MISLCLSMHLVLGLTCCAETPANDTAAWIASLLDYERQHGRDAWSYQELCQARSIVRDPYFAQPQASGMLPRLYLIYLNWYPTLFATLFFLGLWYLGKVSVRAAPGKMVILMMSWLILLWLTLWPLEPDQRTVAVLKYPETLVRTGNGLSYAPVRRDQASVSLTAGVEATVLHEKDNGWVQIRLHDGTQGWVPKESVFLVNGR